jgi:hypothetical protein
MVGRHLSWGDDRVFYYSPDGRLKSFLANCLSSKSGCFAKSATCRNLTSGRLSHVNWAHDPVSSGFSLWVRFLLPLPT